MDIIFEILVPPQTVFPALNFAGRYGELQGVKYPIDPPTCVVDGEFTLKEGSVVPEYLKGCLPQALRKSNFKSLSLKESQRLSEIANSSGKFQRVRSLLDRVLGGLEYWIVVLDIVDGVEIELAFCQLESLPEWLVRAVKNETSLIAMSNAVVVLQEGAWDSLA